jgi:hypothetical protein
MSCGEREHASQQEKERTSSKNQILRRLAVKTISLECVSAKTRIAPGKPGIWMKSRVPWEAR